MLTPIKRRSSYRRRAEIFNQSVKKVGTPVALRRAIRSKVCHCVGRTTSQADPDCAFCLGAGHPYDESIAYAVLERSSNTQATSTLEESSSVGPKFSPFTKFMLMGDTMVKREDMIAEVDFTDGALYHQVISEFQVYGRSAVLEGVFTDTSSARSAIIYGAVWDVQYVDPVVFDGETIYWEAFAKMLRRS